MNLSTLIVLLIVIVLALLAVRVIRRKKLLHTCGGDCARCAGGCRTRERR
ncbi:MAG: FeoB-associated Cys-rich membrane protein [Candidatus Ventricola sp.]